MTEQQLLILLAVFAAGVIFGILVLLIVNKLRSGSVSPAKVKREFDEYQSKVESHFDETSEKFKAMAEQYKDLYEHLSVGATSLCRPEHTVVGLTDQGNPLKSIEKTESTKADSGKEALASTNNAKATEPEEAKDQSDKPEKDASKVEAKADAKASDNVQATTKDQTSSSKKGNNPAVEPKPSAKAEKKLEVADLKAEAKTEPKNKEVKQ